jgi:multiple sugar transport system permease protein
VARLFSIPKLFVGVLVVWSAFPFYWMLKSAIEPAASVYRPHLLVDGGTLENLHVLLTQTSFLGNALNSLIVAATTSVLVVVCSMIGGYVLARYDIPAKRIIAQLVLFTYMFPEILLGIPFFSLFRQLGLLNSLFGLSLAHLTLTFPFALWLMWQTFEAMPREYEEAAAIDGASRTETFLRVVCPMAAPAAAAVLIFAFAASWNDYTLSLMLIRDDQLYTLPVSVSLFVTQLHFNWAVIQGAAILIAVPGLVLLVLGQRYLVRAFGGGGLAN